MSDVIAQALREAEEAGTTAAIVAAFLTALHDAADGGHVELPGDVTVYTGGFPALVEAVFAAEGE